MIKKIASVLLSLLVLIWLVSVLSLRFESHEYTELTEQQKSAAATYLEGKITNIPENWQWFTVEPEPGVTLRGGQIDAENAKGTIIVIPGFTGSIEMIMHEITYLNSAGYRVAALEYRGQGKSYRPLRNPEKGYVKDYSVLASEVAQFAQQSRIEGKPLFFFSISKGAHITMRMAAEHKLDVSAYSLIVPMIQINTGESDYNTTGRLARLFNLVGLGSMYVPGQSQYPANESTFGEATDCNANPETAQTQSALFALQPELRTRGVTMGWVDATISSTKKLLDQEYTRGITAPVNIATAGIDTLVSTEATNTFCSLLKDCSVVHYETSRHCITRENFDVYNDIIRQSIEHFDNNL